MNKQNLKAIKEDMWSVLSNKKYLQATLKQKLRELEAERKSALAECKESTEDAFVLAYFMNSINESYDRRRVSLISDEFEQWHNCQSYYLIHKDGSETVITAEDILGGEIFPKVSDVVYAELQSADDCFDTERGELDWYSDESLEACDYDYDKEDERKWAYETAIQFKFNTEWSRRYAMNHPEFIPELI